jgi:4-amino-4-deoxy-L-arabinose transferase-like glycosyltransferase
MSLWVYLVQPLNRVTSDTDTEMATPYQYSRPADSPRPAASHAWKAAAIGCAAVCLFGAGIFSKSFVDEYAYITQSYYADLFFTGQSSDKLWLDGFACDLQPLPKYLIGLMLRLANLPMPTPADASEWYDNYHPVGTQATLVAARLPTIALGALGCMALFGCGVLFKDWRVGAAAAVLLMINPVYSLHAHRAMSDVPCESFMVTGLCAGLWAWKQAWSRGWGAALFLAAWLAGLCSGLALLCKFNGFVGLAIMVGWMGLTWIAPGLPWIRKIAMTAVTMVTISTAVTVLVAMNPYLTAHPRLTARQSRLLTPEGRVLFAQNPWQRFQAQVKLRRENSDYQQTKFARDALSRIPERVKVLFVQGLGRFGPLGPAESDSTVRFDVGQDWGLVLWAPLLVLGIVQSVRLGRSQFGSGLAPTGVALLIWVVVPWIVLAVYLPMAWDRYLLPIQSGHALLGGMAAVAIWDRLRMRLPLGANRG